MSTYLPNPSITPLVADFGSYSTKIGYAGEDHPSSVYLSSTAALRSDSTASGRFQSPPRRDFITRTLETDDDGNYSIVNPVDDVTGWIFSRPSHCGSLSSNEPTTPTADCWESFELINHYLANSLRSLDIETPHPLIMLDKSHNPPPLRQRMLEVLFEQNNMPAVFMLRDAVAACYAVGRSTATVVDCGYNGTTVTPVYEGFVERRGIRRNNACGSRDVEERILGMMDELVVGAGRKRKDRLKRLNAKKVVDGNNLESSPTKSAPKRDSSGHFVKRASMTEYPIPDYFMPLYQVRRAPVYNTRTDPFHKWARLALAREMKEGGIGAAVGAMGYVASNAAEAGDANTSNAMFMNSSKVPYTLPDGTAVEVTVNARCDVAEVYFGNDKYNTLYRENILEESKARLEQYVIEVEEYCNDWEPSEEDKKVMAGSGASSDGAGDAYSNTSYRGEKSSRHGVRRAKSTAYSPTTVSTKLFSACLPYLRTTPPKTSLDDTSGSGTTTSSMSLDNERCFSYLTSAPPAQMVCDAAFRCDRDQQGALLGNIVVCGGGACLPGAGGANIMAAPVGATTAGSLGQLNEDAFPDRLREEIEAIVHQHTLGWRVKVTSPNVTERSICSWLGGSILGSLGTFQDMWISKQDYEEYGSAIVNRKCP
jgi:actin-related protein